MKIPLKFIFLVGGVGGSTWGVGNTKSSVPCAVTRPPPPPPCHSTLKEPHLLSPNKWSTEIGRGTWLSKISPTAESKTISWKMFIIIRFSFLMEHFFRPLILLSKNPRDYTRDDDELGEERNPTGAPKLWFYCVAGCSCLSLAAYCLLFPSLRLLRKETPLCSNFPTHLTC